MIPSKQLEEWQKICDEANTKFVYERGIILTKAEIRLLRLAKNAIPTCIEEIRRLRKTLKGISDIPYTQDYENAVSRLGTAIDWAKQALGEDRDG